VNLWQMTLRVQKIVDNKDLTQPDQVLTLFNEGLQDVATQINLPALDTWGEVSVSALASNASLPDGFMRELHAVYDAARPDHDLPIVSSLSVLTKEFGIIGSKSGPIEACCEEDGTIYFAPVPVNATSLVVGYYREPTELVDSTDIPSCLPQAFHDACLVNYVAWRLFALMEEGMDGETVMTARYQGFYQQALASLASRYPDTSRKRVRRVRRVRWF